jgi:hypothetical protein
MLTTTTTTTTTPKTFADLQHGDSFAWEPDNKSVCTVVETDGKRFFRYNGGYQRDMEGEANTPVFNVQTEAQRAEAYEKSREEERNKNLAQRASDYAKCKAVAKILGWAIDKLEAPEGYVSDRHAFTIEGDGMELTMSFGSYRHKNRVYIRNRGVEITVSETKTPAQIAQDISRRMLADLKAKTDLDNEKKQKETEYKNTVQANAEKLAKLVGGTIPSHGDSHRKAVYWKGPTFYVGKDSVNFEHLSLDIDDSIEVLTLLKKIQDRKK